MARIVPVKFKRVAEAFDEVVKTRICESSGSEHSPPPESLTNLSQLVNSFLEGEVITVNEKLEEIDGNVETNCFDESEIKENLRNLLDPDGNSGDDLKKNVINAVENALLAEEASSPEFKRWLMTRLRDQGFDAGLCKLKWEKAVNRTSGSYEYIDVNIGVTRYIIEVSLVEEFEIARATPCYTSLLENFPHVFVGKVEELKQVVRIMSRAMKRSMKKMNIYVAPWRRLAYMEAKWFGSYKRTTNEQKDYQKNSFDSSSKKRNVGFVPKQAISFYCRENVVASNSGIKIGNLAAALNG